MIPRLWTNASCAIVHVCYIYTNLEHKNLFLFLFNFPPDHNNPLPQADENSDTLALKMAKSDTIFFLLLVDSLTEER